MNNFDPSQRDEKGRLVKGCKPINPTGKGGFQERPQDRGHTWSKETSPKYLRQKYIRFTLPQLVEEQKRTDLTAAEALVLRQIMEALSTNTEPRLQNDIMKDVFDRVDGRATQSVEQTTHTVEPPTFQVEFRDCSIRKRKE